MQTLASEEPGEGDLVCDVPPRGHWDVHAFVLHKNIIISRGPGTWNTYSERSLAKIDNFEAIQSGRAAIAWHQLQGLRAAAGESPRTPTRLTSPPLYLLHPASLPHSNLPTHHQTPSASTDFVLNLTHHS